MTQPQPVKLGPADIHKYVLYVDTLRDDIVLVAKQSGLLPLAHVQVADKLRIRPAWLRSLPVLVDTEARQGYRGGAAIAFARAFQPPPELRQQVAATAKRQALWARDQVRAQDAEISTRVTTYYTRNE